MEIATLADQVARHARECPDRDAAVFVHWDGREEHSESLTYGELDRAARALAARLWERCRVGDRALLLYPTGREFVISMLASMYAGVIPVPAPLPGGDKHHLTGATGIALDSDPRIVLTDSASLVTVSDWMSQDGLDGLVCIATDLADLGDPGAEAWETPPHVDSDTLAVLQYTMGSTSDPKGVMTSHANLAHNFRLFQSALGLNSEHNFLGWLSLHQGIGLIGLLLTPLYLGSTAILMSARDFFEEPRRWLESIDRHGARVSLAPGFAYRLCARDLTDEQVKDLDLSRWQHACVSGADPIDVDPLIEFAERFSSAGFQRDSFRAGYGVAESTLFVSTTQPGRPLSVRRFDPSFLEKNILVPSAEDSTGRSLVSSGTVSDLDVEIVDPHSAAVLPAGRLGEIWIRGGSVASGYWREERETERAFHATTAGGEAGFLRTGDLGVCWESELYVLGRMTEMLVVHGRSIHPHDVEREVRACDTIFADLTGSVFSIPVPQQEIVVLHEIDVDRVAETLACLATTVRSWVGRRFGVRVASVAFLRPGKVRKTPGGKVRRSLMRELFLADALDPLYEDLDVETRRRYRNARPCIAMAHGGRA